MEYPIQLTFKENLFCRATFPDHPGIFVEGSDAKSTLEKASAMLEKTLINLLKCKGPVQLPSPCKLGQQMIKIPEDLAVRIMARHTLHKMALNEQAAVFLGKS